MSNMHDAYNRKGLPVEQQCRILPAGPSLLRSALLTSSYHCLPAMPASRTAASTSRRILFRSSLDTAVSSLTSK